MGGKKAFLLFGESSKHSALSVLNGSSSKGLKAFSGVAFFSRSPVLLCLFTLLVSPWTVSSALMGFINFFKLLTVFNLAWTGILI